MANYLLRNKDLYVGKEIKAKFNTNPDTSIFGDEYLPLRVVAEYPKWWLTEVLPHKNNSAPYPMTIRKWDLEHGEVKAREA